MQDIAKEKACTEYVGIGIDPEQGDIGKTERPCCEECMRAIENAQDVGKNAAIVRHFPYHVTETSAHDDEARCAYQDGDNCPQWASIWQERGSRHNDRAPADNTAKGQRPYAQWYNVLGLSEESVSLLTCLDSIHPLAANYQAMSSRSEPSFLPIGR